MEVALVGNPNTGKTTLFNGLTGANQQVGNWAGVTVEKKTGSFREQDTSVQIVDLPGVYSLSAPIGGSSLDERIASTYILSKQPKVIINILDATHLERGLYLTMQLLEMNVPLILVVNMLDIAKRRQIEIDLTTLSQQFGCPVIGLVAHQKEGLTKLRQAIVALANKATLPSYQPHYPAVIENAIVELMQSIPVSVSAPRQARMQAVRLLEEDAVMMGAVEADVLAKAAELRTKIVQELDEELDILLADSRYRAIAHQLQGVILQAHSTQKTITHYLDKIVLNRLLGVPIFLFVMYLMFFFAVNIGGALQDFFDISGNTIFIQGMGHLFQAIGAPDWFTAIVASGIGMGITTTLTFIPVIGSLFLFLALLESSGYMARAAFVMDRLMRALGLPGKAFVPMIVGFGCNVPSIMAARTLEHQRDRILTIMMSPFMSCGARLAIYVIFVAAFFPHSGQNVILALYLVGILMAIATGLLLRKTLLTGISSPLIMELPPYHVPQLKNLLLNAWHRLKSFLSKASRVIIPLCVLIGFLNALTTDGKINLAAGHQDSVLSAVGRTITPVFAPLGISENNWPATVGIATGMLAKEVVLATLNTLYSQAGGLAEPTEEVFNFWGGMQEAVVSIPNNFAKLGESLANPILATAPDNEITEGVYGQMYQRFDGVAGAFAYLLFLLLYVPCVSTMAAIAKELNGRWALFSCAWTIGVAFGAATLFYQMATFNRHPFISLTWLVTILTVFLGVIAMMRFVGQKMTNKLALGVS